MSLYRISSRFPRTVLARNSLLIYTCKNPHPIQVASNQFLSVGDPQNKLQVFTSQVSMLHHSALNASVFQRFGFSSFASRETTEKENAQSENGAAAKTSGDTEVPEQREASSSEDSEDELSMEDLVKLVTEKEQLLKAKHKEIEKMQDKVLRSYAEMENVIDRTKREAENSKKFAIQNFAKGLLDVADNLGRASSVVKDSFSKIDASKDTAGAVPLLKTLLEGVEMTEKQLAEVFKKFGVMKYDPTNEQFDPNRHNAVFQVPDASKPPGTVAVVLKPGYSLHDRVIRPAEVGVTPAADNEAAN
ncbi:Protein GrpE like [Actinidia chinensis var. chinensis]|uniref:GrpE protein homolog n=1 Tax=Actinidia chinensis var. chinensis TaxID=1590841 RepID=A0A2R6PT82_ACTCC|nr:Protein GrpE like [Actinidia chinensis var. chinensis]